MGIAGASTVTLTGTCYSKIINQTNNYIQFNLTNSGNGTATNLLIAPTIEGASTASSSFLIPLVVPGGTYSERIYLSNFTMPGSYVERFVTRYAQGTSTFITLFPCLVTMGRPAPSLLGIKGLNKTNRGSNITVNISSIAGSPINAQVSLFAPPDFVIENPVRNVTINGYSYALESFGVSTPQYNNAEFPIVAAVSYISDNTHYATLGITTINFGEASPLLSGLGGSIVLILIIAVIIIILILLVLSVVLKRRRQKKHSETA